MKKTTDLEKLIKRLRKLQKKHSKGPCQIIYNTVLHHVEEECRHLKLSLPK